MKPWRWWISKLDAACVLLLASGKSVIVIATYILMKLRKAKWNGNCPTKSGFNECWCLESWQGEVQGCVVSQYTYWFNHQAATANWESNRAWQLSRLWTLDPSKVHVFTWPSSSTSTFIYSISCPFWANRKERIRG